MADPHYLVEQIKQSNALRDLADSSGAQAQSMESLASTISLQAEAAKRSQIFSARVAGGSLLVAAASLTVAILTLVLK